MLKTKFRRNVVGGICLLLIFAVLFSIAFTLYNAVRPTGTSAAVDTGVTACKGIADNAENGKGISNGKMTKDKYREARLPFEKSKHPDIQTAGIDMIDTVYKASTTPDTSFSGPVDMLATIQKNWGDLQVACANHGVAIPDLPTSS